ncbi:tetratricopeptide repeat protein [Nisaea sediminum]|uniref:tetratricopeptide repeat protein n=1 Tax=Nisaea sediminum TaxID=2775867 RepID=UPI0018680AE4|nr:tetratricopeptide repeat protein [Nisaea sediminum]
MNGMNRIQDLITSFAEGGAAELLACIDTLDDQTVLTTVGAAVSGGLSDASARAVRAIGHHLLHTDRMEPALTLFATMIQSPYLTRGDVYALGHTLIGYSGLWTNPDLAANAVTVMSILTKLDENDFDAWMNVAGVWLDTPVEYVRAGDLKAAVEACKRIRPQSAEAHYVAGMYEQQFGDLRSAVGEYETALELDPGHVAARFRLWQMARARGDRRVADLELQVDDRAGDIDVPADAEDAARHAYKTFGGTVLRGALSQTGFDSLITDLEPWLRKYMAEEHRSSVGFKKASESVQARLLEILNGESIGKHVLQALGRWGGKGWKPHKHGQWLLQWHEPSDPKPTSLHQDYPVYADNADWFTIWMPFVECGPGIAPGLEVLPVRVNHPIHFVRERGQYINPVPLEDAVEYFAPFMVRPTFEPGDILVFDKTSIHRTYTERNLVRNRVSFDSRFQVGASPRGYPEETAAVA